MISVCIATHNGEKYIHEQLSSILSQLSNNDEIIISDDGSQDNTISIIESFKDSRIKVVLFQPPKGLKSFRYATLNFENALRHAKGDYIFLSDQDDVWLENKVEISLRYLNKYDYIVSDAYVTDANLKIVLDTRFAREENVHTNKFMAVLFKTPYQGSCAAFNRKVLEKALPFPKGIQSHDRWIGNVAAFYFNYKIIPDKLIYYRRHENVTSKALGGNGSSSSTFQKIIYKIGYIKGLLSIIGK